MNILRMGGRKAGRRKEGREGKEGGESAWWVGVRVLLFSGSQ